MKNMLEDRERTSRFEEFHAKVMAGCDIQKGDRLYRQVLVVHGTGITQAEIDLKKARDLISRTVENLDDFLKTRWRRT